MGRGKLAKKQEELQFYKARVFKLKQQKASLTRELELAKERVKSANLGRDECCIRTRDLAGNLDRAMQKIDRLELELRRADVSGRHIPYDLCDEISMTMEDLLKLPEYSFTLPDCQDKGDAFRWRRKATPTWSPYHGIADEWIMGKVVGYRPASSTVSIRWYKVNIESAVSPPTRTHRHG